MDIWIQCPKCKSPQEFLTIPEITLSRTIVSIYGRCGDCGHELPKQITNVHSPDLQVFERVGRLWT